jgi:hypothetical protein
VAVGVRKTLLGRMIRLGKMILWVGLAVAVDVAVAVTVVVVVAVAVVVVVVVGEPEVVGV